MKQLVVSVGDPAGVGPIVVAKALCDERFARQGFLLFVDAVYFSRLLREFGCVRSLRVVQSVDEVGADENDLVLVNAQRWPDAMILERRATPECGKLQLEILQHSLRAVQRGIARALVTGPVSKKAISLGGTPFRGHTEWLAEQSGLAADDVTMLFSGQRYWTALVTTHVPLRKVHEEVTEFRVRRSVQHLYEALLRKQNHSRELRIAVLGINPHAGEQGQIGDEEQRIIAPLVRALQNENASQRPGLRLEGPLSSEAGLRAAAASKYDGVVAMYHDQATVPLKLLEWGTSVNITWGLPFVRTSVDHGVGYDAAARGLGDAEGMVAAIEMAQQLTQKL